MAGGPGHARRLFDTECSGSSVRFRRADAFAERTLSPSGCFRRADAFAKRTLQGVENSELGYVPARQTTLLHHCARQADCGYENPTADGQRDIRLQEAAVRTQPGDASSSAVWSWELDGHGRAGWQLDRVVPRGETSETPDPIMQRGPPDLVVISHQGGVCEEHLQLCGEYFPPFVHPRLNVESRQTPLTNFWCCGDSTPSETRRATMGKTPLPQRCAYRQASKAQVPARSSER